MSDFDHIDDFIDNIFDGVKGRTANGDWYSCSSVKKCVKVVILAYRGKRERKLKDGHPKPFTTEYLNYLLVNALRHLNPEQRHSLTVTLMERDEFLASMEKQDQFRREVMDRLREAVIKAGKYDSGYTGDDD